MAKIVAAFGSSHSAMLHAAREHWIALFDHVDCKVPVLDAAGDPSSYEAMRAAAGKRAHELVAPAVMARRFDETFAAMERLERDIAACRLDALIVVGDDQRELFQDACRPAIGVYYGETIRNAAAPQPPPEDWFRRAQQRRMEPGQDAHYPCHAPLGRHLIEGLSAHGFDVTAIKGLVGEQSEGHAFSFLHRRFLQGSTTRMVPIFLNTYYPPNQPTPDRCFALGLAIGASGAGIRRGYPRRRLGLRGLEPLSRRRRTRRRRHRGAPPQGLGVPYRAIAAPAAVGHFGDPQLDLHGCCCARSQAGMDHLCSGLPLERADRRRAMLRPLVLTAPSGSQARRPVSVEINGCFTMVG